MSTTTTPPESAATGIEITDEFSSALRAMREGRNVFLTGKAGTGKSTLVRKFLGESTKNVQVVAPTGLAALNVGGLTVHRLLSIVPGMTMDHVSGARSTDRGPYRPKRFAKVIRNLDTLVVDEASMVRADLFDMMEMALRRFGPNPGKPFGGIQMVLVGDLYQLPPVVTGRERRAFEQSYRTPFFFSSEAYAGSDFMVVQLSRVFRQEGNDRLIEVLNAVRDGSANQGDLDFLNSRVDPDFQIPEDEMWMTLTATNAVSDRINAQRLRDLPDEERTFTGTSWGTFKEKDAPAPIDLRLREGAQVMLLTNKDEEDFDKGIGTWVNGTLGMVVGFKEGSLSFFGDSPGGSVLVETEEGDLLEVKRHTWEIQEPVTVELTEAEKRVAEASGLGTKPRLDYQVTGAYTQFPMKLAWSVSIHKSQGQTLDRAVLDLTGGTFADGQLYVALSRCTSLEGMVLRQPLETADVRADSRVSAFLGRAEDADKPKGLVHLSATVIPDPEGNPRILELAAVGDDWTEVETLVNPHTDSYVSCIRHGIEPSDLVFAPDAAQAWSAIASRFPGRAVVAHQAETILAAIDADVRRAGFSARVPAEGIEGRPAFAGSAIERARASAEHGAQSVADIQIVRASADLPEPITLPRGGNWVERMSGRSRSAAAEHVLRCARRVGITDQLAESIGRFEERIGQKVLPERAGEIPSGSKVHVAGPAYVAGNLLSAETLERYVRAAKLKTISSPDRAKGQVLIVHDPLSAPPKTSSDEHLLLDAETFVSLIADRIVD